MSQDILAIAEQTDGDFRRITFEVLSEGKRIAKAFGGKLTVLVLGSDMEAKAGVLATYGADVILVADHPELAEFRSDIYAKVVADIAQQKDLTTIIMGGSARGKDLAARLTARMDAALAMDGVEVSVDADQITVTRPMYGGKVLADVVLANTPRIVVLRPNAVSISESAGDGTVETVDVDPGPSGLTFIEKKVETGKVELTEADVIVSGGRGMGGPDYSVIEQLAEVLGGAVGASRSAVDEGWRPHSDQVGQTGKVVSPSLYIACGISGAIQHLAGMSTSKVIVAINKDPEAPIFSVADYGIVGDLFEVVPLITEEVKKVK